MNDRVSDRAGILLWIVRAIVVGGVLLPVGIWAWITLVDHRDTREVASTHEAIGDKAYAAGEYEQAIVAYQQARSARDTGAIQVKWTRAMVHSAGLFPEKLDQRNLAELDHRRKWLMDRDPGSDPTCLALAGHMKMLANRGEEAAAAYTESLKQDGDNLSAHLGLGLLNERQGNHEEAVAGFERVLAGRPEHYRSLVALGGIRLNTGKVDDAIMLLGKAIGLRDGWDVRLSMGIAYAQKKENQNAERQLNRAYQLNPQSYEVLSALGNFYFNVGAYKRSESAFAGALQVKKDEMAASGLARALSAQSRPQECLGVLQSFLRSGSAGPGTMIVAAACHEALKQVEEAGILYKAALELIPKLHRQLPVTLMDSMKKQAEEGLARLAGAPAAK